MDEISLQNISDKLKSFCSQKPFIAFCYIFGSRARGAITPLSDIDIAMFIDTDKASLDLFELRLRELNALYQLLKTDKIDLIFLNEAPLELSYRVLREGILIVERNEQLRARFQENIVSKYLDMKYLFQRRIEIIKKKMAKGSYYD